MAGLTTFKPFTKLPAELQLMIWEHACRIPRVIEIAFDESYNSSNETYATRNLDKSKEFVFIGCAPSWDTKFFAGRSKLIPPVLQACFVSRMVAQQYYTKILRDRSVPLYFNNNVDTIYFDMSCPDVWNARRLLELVADETQLRSVAVNMWELGDALDFDFAYMRAFDKIPGLKELVLAVEPVECAARMDIRPVADFKVLDAIQAGRVNEWKTKAWQYFKDALTDDENDDGWVWLPNDPDKPQWMLKDFQDRNAQWNLPNITTRFLVLDRGHVSGSLLPSWFPLLNSNNNSIQQQEFNIHNK